jgi:hypothetical protein
MTLEMRATDLSFDLADAVAYEFFMNNLEGVLDDSLSNPELTDEKVLEIVETITLLAGMAYGIAGKFESVRAEFKKKHNDQAESD